jgi:integrase
MARGSRGTKIAPGIWKDEFGFAVQVSVGTSGKSKQQRENRYPFETKLKTMTDWQDETRVALRKLLPKHGKGTLAAAVVTYLKSVASMPTFKDRERDLGLWVAEFQNRQRHSIKTHEISAVLHQWINEGLAPMTVINRRTALMAVWTALDGKKAPNPVDESFRPDPPPLAANDIPWPTIEKVLDAVEDRGQGIRGQTRGHVSKTKIRLRLIAYTGLPHKLVKQITEDGIDWENGKVLAAKRRKGTGVEPRWLPLSEDAIPALEDFVEHDCFGSFSNSSMLKTWQRAWRWVHPGWPVDKPIPCVYRLRHSFATATYAKSGDDRGTALLLMHSRKSHMMPRYTLGAEPERMERCVEAFSARRLELVKDAKNRKPKPKRKTG